VLFEAAVGREGRHLFIPAKILGKQVRLQLDTGCTRSALDLRFQAELTPSRDRIEIETPGGFSNVEGFQCPPIELGTLTVSSSGPIFCTDFSAVRQMSGQAFDGVLGMDVLSNFIVQIDFDAGKVRFLKDLPTTEWLGSAIPIIYGDRREPLVQVRCGDASHRLIIDTGSNSTCLEKELFDVLAKAGAIDVGGTHSVMTASGEVGSRSGLLRELAMGPFTHSDTLCDRDRLGLLGLKYLSRFHVTMDFPAKTAYFREGSRYAEADPRGVTGLRPVPTETGFRVGVVAPGGAASLAGVLPGDEILAINGESTDSMDLFEMGRILTSKPGRTLVMSLRRDGRELEARPTIKDRFSISQAERP